MLQDLTDCRIDERKDLRNLLMPAGGAECDTLAFRQSGNSIENSNNFITIYHTTKELTDDRHVDMDLGLPSSNRKWHYLCNQHTQVELKFQH